MAEEAAVLGMPWDQRGKRSDEQLEIFARLFNDASPSFDGEFYRFEPVGFEPKPIQRPIPIWIGGTTEIPIKRAARIGDGWFPMGPIDDAQRAKLRLLRETAQSVGRDPKEIGIDARIDTFRTGEENWERNIAAWAPPDPARRFLSMSASSARICICLSDSSSHI